MHRWAAMALLTLVGIYICYRLAEPLIPALAWAAALAVIGWPLHRWLAGVIPHRTIAAALSTVIVVAAIAVPIVLVTLQLAEEFKNVVKWLDHQAANGDWREHVAKIPYVGEAIANVDGDDIRRRAEALGKRLAEGSGHFAGGMADFLLQSLVAVFVIFFCFRDREQLMQQVQQRLPLDRTGSRHILNRASDAIHATVFGTMLTSMIQAVTGSLLFWALGLPAPVLWGAVMFILGILPVLGAFFVWVPAAIYFIANDQWMAALALVVWGVIMAGPMSNYVYAAVAGNRLRLHPIPTLIAFIGGLAVFGISGMVLGPCALAMTIALIDMWRDEPESIAVP